VSRLDKLRETHPVLVEYIAWSSLAVTLFAAALLAYYFRKATLKRRQRRLEGRERRRRVGHRKR
jgi:peptidoglycan/LPS O-acetylase OafA/YrhL